MWLTPLDSAIDLKDEILVRSKAIFLLTSLEILEYSLTISVLAIKVEPHSLHKNLCFFRKRIVGILEILESLILQVLVPYLIILKDSLTWPQHGQTSGL